jgi:hypothetical protein
MIYFLDKIIYPDTLDQIIADVTEFVPESIKLTFAAVLPEVQTPYKNYPFSLSMLFDCLERALQREDHETLKGDPELIAAVVIRCFHHYQNIDFESGYLSSKGIRTIIKIPFVREISNFEDLVGPDLIQELDSIFAKHKPCEYIQEESVAKLLQIF